MALPMDGTSRTGQSLLYLPHWYASIIFLSGISMAAFFQSLISLFLAKNNRGKPLFTSAIFLTISSLLI
jgi:hypothetical protein